jgi:hypothetical protein
MPLNTSLHHSKILVRTLRGMSCFVALWPLVRFENTSKIRENLDIDSLASTGLTSTVVSLAPRAKDCIYLLTAGQAAHLNLTSVTNFRRRQLPRYDNANLTPDD